MKYHHLVLRHRGIALLMAGALALGSARRAGASVIRLPGNPDDFALNNAGEVLWSNGWPSFWDGATIHQAPPDARGAVEGPWEFSDDGAFVWRVGSSTGYDIKLWVGAQVRLLGQYSETTESPRINAVGQAVWEGDEQIYLWDGRQVRQLSAGIPQNSHPRLNDAGQVVWSGAGQVFFWDGARVRPLSQIPAGHLLWNTGPEINAAGQAAWTGILDSAGANVYFWDGAAEWRLTQPEHSASGLMLNDAGQMVWLDRNLKAASSALDVWDGTRIRPLSQPEDDLAYSPPNYQINNRGEVVWDERKSGEGWPRIRLWDGATVRDIAGHPVHDALPQINDAGQVAWADTVGTTPQVLLWDGQAVQQISNNPAPAAGAENDIALVRTNRRGQVAWGTTGSIFLYTPPPG